MAEEPKAPVVLLVLIILGLIGLCLYFSFTISSLRIEAEKLQEQEEKEVPIILSLLDSWGGYTDADEVYMSGTTYNFGDVEAKNLTLECEFNRYSDDHYLGTHVEELSNIASESYAYYDFEFPSPDYYKENSEDIMTTCEIKECSEDCKILDGIIE